MKNLPFFYCFSSFIFFASIKLLLAADTTSPEVIIQDGEILTSSAHRFQLGFFSPGISKNRYLGIWYKESPETVAWVANRNNPIFDSNGVLAISKNGSLILLDERKSIIWSSNMSRKVEDPVAELLDTGNFVLMDNFTRNVSEYVWQSFDYPSDILLPGMKLGRYLKTGVESYLTSWRSDDDPSSGDFTFGVDTQFLPQLVIYNGSTKVTRSGTWNGFFFGGIPIKTNLPFKPILVHNQNEYTFRYESLNHSIVMQLKLNKFGVTEWQIWNDSSSGWDVNYSAPEGLCGHYGFCGANSVCDIEKKPICECLKGFVPNSQNNQTSSTACVRASPLDCEGRDRFIKLEGIKLPDLLDVSVNESMNLKECEAKCLKNCSCTAYINSNLTGGDTGCFTLFGDLIDIRKLVENRGTRHIYLRVPASELLTNSRNKTSTDSEDNKNKSRQLWIIVIPIMSLTIVTLVFITLHVRRKCRRKGEDLLLFDLGQISEDLELTEVKTLGKNRKKKVKLPLFSFASVSAATDNFSASNKLGEGGFGPVYKGKLLRGEEIAVKRLSKRSGQGWEELKNEAVLIAKLQHKNLARLLGCCIEQHEKILIYEYMPNKSLDVFLFDPTKRVLLDWGTRVRIIEGIAQGLLYLHEYSRLRIIHRDLKASNILLDKDMNPKISDFGLAKICHCNESEASTNRIFGTRGYMSPEYAFEGVYSIKSDIFSFGVLLLEIVSGKKSTGLYQINRLNLLGHAWDLWTSDRASELMDPLIEDASSEHILLRYVNIALLCVEESAEDRPTMSDVVLMLMNDSAPIPSPKQPAFARVGSTTNSKSFSSESENCFLNNVTV